MGGRPCSAVHAFDARVESSHRVDRRLNINLLLRQDGAFRSTVNGVLPVSIGWRVMRPPIEGLADRHHRGAHQGADGTGRLVQLEPFRLPGYLDCYEVTGHARAVGERPSAHPASLRCELRTPESYKRRAGRNRHAAQRS